MLLFSFLVLSSTSPNPYTVHLSIVHGISYHYIYIHTHTYTYTHTLENSDVMKSGCVYSVLTQIIRVSLKNNVAVFLTPYVANQSSHCLMCPKDPLAI